MRRYEGAWSAEPEKLRIAMISEHASPLATVGGVDAGGQNVYVEHVARCLARQGHAVDVLTRRDSPDLPAVVDLAPGVRVVHIDAGVAAYLPKERMLDCMPEFARQAERWLGREPRRPDVVHAHFFMSGLVAQHLQRRLGLPFVMTFHALGRVRRQHQREADAFPAERLAIEDALVRDADAVIAECPQDQRDLTALYHAEPGRMALVPCGYDPAEFAPMDRAAARARLGLDPADFIVLQLGRMVPRKGVDNVIRAVARLPPARPVRLLVVGGNAPPDAATATSTPPPETAELARLRRLAAECGAADRVDFVGHRPRSSLRLYYAAADVFATTPWYEPFGITPLEAMACGTPVVGSRVGGIQYSVADGVTGYLVPPHDPAALAGRLAALQADRSIGAAMGQAGIRRARSLFTWERVANELAAVYRRVMQRPAQAADGGPLPVDALLPRPAEARLPRPTEPALGHRAAGARA